MLQVPRRVRNKQGQVWPCRPRSAARQGRKELHQTSATQPVGLSNQHVVHTHSYCGARQVRGGMRKSFRKALSKFRDLAMVRDHEIQLAPDGLSKPPVTPDLHRLHLPRAGLRSTRGWPMIHINTPPSGSQAILKERRGGRVRVSQALSQACSPCLLPLSRGAFGCAWSNAQTRPLLTRFRDLGEDIQRLETAAAG